MKKLLIFLLIFNITHIYGQVPDKLWNKVRFENMEFGRKYEIVSGTGFFINKNYILTSEHVVQSCKNIAVRGAVSPTKAKIYAVDKINDLALLYVPSSSFSILPTLKLSNDLRIAEKIFVVGYPQEYGKTGQFIIKDAQIIDLYNAPPFDKVNNTFIEFSGIVEHGNSGGPILNEQLQIIGLVKAKKTYFLEDTPQIPIKVTGIGVSIEILKDFLNRNNIVFSSDNGSFAVPNIREFSKNYIVNVHCVQNPI